MFCSPQLEELWHRLEGAGHVFPIHHVKVARRKNLFGGEHLASQLFPNMESYHITCVRGNLVVCNKNTVRFPG